MSKSQYNKKPWMYHYHLAKQRCSIYGEYIYYLRNIKVIITPQQIKKLWEQSNAENMKKPVLHRLNEYHDYSYENCKFIENDLHINIHGKGANGKIFAHSNKNIYRKSLLDKLSPF